MHVEANVDAAAGGHSGLRVGSLVYHYLQSEDGLLCLTRTDWVGFRHVYAGLRNRPLTLYHLDLDRSDAERVALHASGEWIDFERDRAGVRRLAADAAWWAAARDGTPPPALATVGLLGDGGDDASGRALRAALRERFGDDFAARRLDELATLLAAAAAEPALVVVRERATERAIVRALARAAGLAPEAPIELADAALRDTAERRSLELLRARLVRSVLELWSSSRPDRGRALAVAAARHHAVDRSLLHGRLVLLDGFPDDAETVRPDAEEAQLAYAPLARRAGEVLDRLRAEILDGDLPSEHDWGRLEEAAARHREAERGARGELVRLRAGRLLPARGRVVAMPPELAAVAPELVRARARAAHDAWLAADRRLRADHEYRLLERNCATELVRLLNDGFADPAAAERALGTRLEPGADFGFIPWVLADQVRAGLRLREIELVRSHRQVQLDALRSDPRRSGSLWRETTTWTSTTYTPRAADGWFLFFTDDAFWTRPLRGLANLGCGLGCGALGLLSLPFDGGKNVEAGLHGAFYSLPELVFCNIRKGTYAYVEPRADADDERAVD